MKILAVSDDNAVYDELASIKEKKAIQLNFYEDKKDCLKLFAFLCTKLNGTVIIDHDFLKTRTIPIIRNLKQLNENLKIIFITSDNSVALGKSVISFGFLSYLIKPIPSGALVELLLSLNEKQTQFTNQFTI